MYSVPGTDIVFACIMCALTMALAYVIGMTHGHIKLKEQLAAANKRKAELNHYWYETAAKLKYANGVIEDQEGVWKLLMAMAVKKAQRELSKKHRDAMKKYRAKCDRQVVHHMETYKANQQVMTSGYDHPDFSALVSK